MDYRLINYNVKLKTIINLLRNNKLNSLDLKNNFEQIIDHYHLRTLRTKRCYNLLDFIHDLYELQEYDIINDIVQYDQKFIACENIYDSLLAYEIYKNETSCINVERLKLLLSFPPENYNWNVFFKEFIYNVSESGYDDYIPELFIIIKESNIIEVIEYITEYWGDNKDFLFGDNLSKIEYIDKIIHN